jgi:hypothetical protein
LEKSDIWKEWLAQTPVLKFAEFDEFKSTLMREVDPEGIAEKDAKVDDGGGRGRGRGLPPGSMSRGGARVQRGGAAGLRGFRGRGRW